MVLSVALGPPASASLGNLLEMSILGLWEDGRIGGTGNLFPHLDNNYTGRSVCSYSYGTLESVEGLQLPRKDPDGKLQLILVNFGS